MQKNDKKHRFVRVARCSSMLDELRNSKIKYMNLFRINQEIDKLREPRVQMVRTFISLELLKRDGNYKMCRQFRVKFALSNLCRRNTRTILEFFLKVRDDTRVFVVRRVRITSVFAVCESSDSNIFEPRIRFVEYNTRIS